MKEKLVVYIVYAPKASCNCTDKENRVKGMLCQCDFTYKRLIYSSIAQMHRKIQNDAQSYQCQVCHSIASPPLQTDQDDCSAFQCDRCNIGFVTETNLKAHQQVCLKFVQLGQVFKCLQCKTQLKNHEEMVQHTLSIHTKKDGTPLNISINICPVCGNNYATTKLLKAHLQTHPSYAKMGLVCCVCGLKETDPFKLAQHARLHMNGNRGKGQAEEQVEVLRERNQCQSESGSKSQSGSNPQSLCGSKTPLSDLGSRANSRRKIRIDDPELDSGPEVRTRSVSKSQSGSGSMSSPPVFEMRSGARSGVHEIKNDDARSESSSEVIYVSKSGTKSVAGSGTVMSESVFKLNQSSSVLNSSSMTWRKAGGTGNKIVQPQNTASGINMETNKVVENNNAGMRLRPRKQRKPSMYVDDIESVHEFERTTEKRSTRAVGEKSSQSEIEIMSSSNTETQEKSCNISSPTKDFPDLPHACVYCERAFTNHGYLNLHKLKVHNGRNPYVCLICKRRFSDKTLFNLHREMHKETFKCSFCPKTFSRLELLHNHDQVHGKSQFSTFKCPDCEEAFHDAKSLYEHMQSHRKENPKGPVQQNKTNMEKSKSKQGKSVRYSCPSCERTFPSQFALRIHEKSVHKSDKVFQCSYCEKQFNFETDHKIHESLHKEYSGLATKGQKYKCRYCGKRLQYKSDLKMHEALHEDILKQLSCDKCDKVFESKQEMKHHRRSHFRDKLPKPTKCPDCDETFIWGTQLREHKKTHWAEKPFLCVYCRNRFKTQEELTEHEPMHTKDKHHQCHICNRRFKDKAHIRDHMLIHTGEKPFSCHYCGKRFRQIGQRRTHERVHTREKPFICDICNRAFLYWSSLRVHKKSHYKDKPPEEVEKILKKTRISAKKKETNPGSKEKKKKLPVRSRTVANTSQAACESQQQQTSGEQQQQHQQSQQVSTIVSTQTLQRQQNHETSAPQQHELTSAPQLPHDIQTQPVTNVAPRQSINLPIHLTIPSNAEQMQVEHIASQLQRPPDNLHQQQQHPPVASDTPWDSLHARYLNNPTPHHQSWQQAPPNWQSLSTTQPMQNPGTSWDMAPAGNWVTGGAPGGAGPPVAHQSHASSILTSALYGIMQRENDGRGFQQ